MDRHAAYVALSRHRSQVDLHYGRDDFGDEKKVMRMLSRERGKDMASDYAAEQVRAPEPPPPKRDIFAGLKLRASPQIERAAPDPLAQAVERFGRAAQNIARMREQGYDMLPHQREALLKAKDELEALRPDAGEDLRVAMNRDRSLIGEAAEGKTQRAIRAMTMQRDMRIDAANRADQFVADWQAKARMIKQLERSGAYGELARVKESMAEMSKSLQRDPQLESLLGNRHKELGIKAPGGASLSHDLQQWLGRSRSRGLEL
jgi:hypothetical protein